MTNIKLTCTQCGSENISVQLINKQELHHDKPGCLWWAIIGWWWVPVKWIFLTLFAILLKVLRPKNKLVNRVEAHKVCNNCGHHWQ